MKKVVKEKNDSGCRTNINTEINQNKNTKILAVILQSQSY
jgi:hypothetical protein